MTPWSHASVVPLHSRKGKEHLLLLTATTRWVPDTLKQRCLPWLFCHAAREVLQFPQHVLHTMVEVMCIKYLLCCRPLDKVLGLEDGLHHKAISVMGQASPEVVNSDRLIGRQGVPAKRARPAPQRALVNITNTAKIAVRKRQVAHLVKDVGGCTAASVPDLVTFWEQRACVQEC